MSNTSTYTERWGSGLGRQSQSGHNLLVPLDTVPTSPLHWGVDKRQGSLNGRLDVGSGKDFYESTKSETLKTGRWWYWVTKTFLFNLGFIVGKSRYSRNRKNFPQSLSYILTSIFIFGNPLEFYRHTNEIPVSYFSSTFSKRHPFPLCDECFLSTPIVFRPLGHELWFPSSFSTSTPNEGTEMKERKEVYGSTRPIREVR